MILAQFKNKYTFILGTLEYDITYSEEVFWNYHRSIGYLPESVKMLRLL